MRYFIYTCNSPFKVKIYFLNLLCFSLSCFSNWWMLLWHKIIHFCKFFKQKIKNYTIQVNIYNITNFFMQIIIVSKSCESNDKNECTPKFIQNLFSLHKSSEISLWVDGLEMLVGVIFSSCPITMGNFTTFYSFQD